MLWYNYWILLLLSLYLSLAKKLREVKELKTIRCYYYYRFGNFWFNFQLLIDMYSAAHKKFSLGCMLINTHFLWASMYLNGKRMLCTICIGSDIRVLLKHSLSSFHCRRLTHWLRSLQKPQLSQHTPCLFLGHRKSVDAKMKLPWKLLVYALYIYGHHVKCHNISCKTLRYQPHTLWLVKLRWYFDYIFFSAFCCFGGFRLPFFFIVNVPQIHNRPDIAT